MWSCRWLDWLGEGARTKSDPDWLDDEVAVDVHVVVGKALARGGCVTRVLLGEVEEVWMDDPGVVADVVDVEEVGVSRAASLDAAGGLRLGEEDASTSVAFDMRIHCSLLLSHTCLGPRGVDARLVDNDVVFGVAGAEVAGAGWALDVVFELVGVSLSVLFRDDDISNVMKPRVRGA